MVEDVIKIRDLVRSKRAPPKSILIPSSSLKSPKTDGTRSRTTNEIKLQTYVTLLYREEKGGFIVYLIIRL